MKGIKKGKINKKKYFREGARGWEEEKRIKEGQRRNIKRILKNE